MFFQRLLGNITQFVYRPLTIVPQNVVGLFNMRCNQRCQNFLTSMPSWSLFSCFKTSLARMHRVGPIKKKKKVTSPLLDGCPQKRGVILKVLIKKPRKPNSANRKCVRVRLTNGKEGTAYVPGEGHNLQEHGVVLVQGGKLQDVSGVRLVCVRGKYDLAHVKKKTA